MEEKPIDSETLFPHETGHHTSSRERQRKGPMWGCLRLMMWGFVLVVAIAILLVVVAPWVATMAITGNYVRQRIEATLESRLQREVTIGRLEVVRTGYFEPTKVVLYDLRISNAPGAVNPFFARVARVEITGGIRSFLRRTVSVERIDIVEPHVNVEIYPEGAELIHNFPRWQTGPKRPYEIYRLQFDRMYVRGGRFLFLDRRHDIVGEATAVSSDITITAAEQLYAGLVTSPRFVFRLQDYEPVELDLRGGFRYTPGVLALDSIALRGRGVEAFVSGKLDPLTEGVYDLHVRSNIGLERVREVFRVAQTLGGSVSLDTQLRGKAGEFRMTGGWVSGSVTADTYQLRDLRGTLDVTGERAHVHVERAGYGGGTISADYRLAQYGEPYPMSVDLRYNGVSIEHLFGDWGVRDTGLRGAATGSLRYGWNKDAILEGAGEGTARLARTVAFSRARYPIPLAGSTDFALDRGVITFRRADLQTADSRIALRGSLRIENLIADWNVQIASDDFSELDRAAFNFAHATGNTEYDLLGLGGAGEISGTVRGPLQSPQVAARIEGRSVRYNEVLLGAADIVLRYDGDREVLTFERAVFADGAGRLVLTGTIAFPDRGPSPRFDLAVEALNYPIERATRAVELDFQVGAGLGTGRMFISGTPESGTVRFADMLIRRDGSDLRLNGLVAWAPGEGNVRFDLDIAAREFPVSEILAFLDLGNVPVTGQLTGTLHLEGTRAELEGAGAITIRKGTIFGEPVEIATADIVFDRGRLRAREVRIVAPAGEITGEADYEFATERFAYTITSSSLDLAQLQILAGLRNLFGGRIVISSTGAGTLENPELVVEARLLDGAIEGLQLPDGTPPPSLYLAIRGGRLIIRGSIGDIVTIEGDGSVGENLAVDGAVRVVIHDFARLVSLSPRTAGIPAAGNAVMDLRLGGRLAPLEALVVEATVPELDLLVSNERFTPREPIRLSLRDGRITFDAFALLHANSSFEVAGFAEVVGARRLNVDVRGDVQAALLQLFMPDARADGQVQMAATIRGTLAAPLITGRAELQDAQVKFAGFPQLIDDIHGTLFFRGDRIDIESLRATIGGGEVIAGGHVALEGFSPKRVQLTLRGTNVALRYYEGLTIAGNFTLQVAGDSEQALVLGDVRVTRALYSRDFDLQQALLNVVLARRGITPVVPAAWQDRVLLRIRVEAPGTLAVRNNIANVTGTAELDVGGTLASPVIMGTVFLDEGGSVTFQNIDYRVVRGTINFLNPFRIDPYFDVTLEGRVSGTLSEFETGPIDLTVNVTGTLDRLSPSITSDPPASDITLFSLLGFGDLSRRDGALAGAGAVVGLGQSLLTQSLISALGSRVLPFADSFTYDPGLLSTGSGAGPRVTFEKRVSNTVRLLVVYHLDSHKSREVIEWQATRDWTLQITRDESESEYRAEGRFRRRYRGHWTWGRLGRGEEVFPLDSAVEAVSGEVAIAPLPAVTRVTTLEPGTVVRQVNIRADGGFETAAVRQHIGLAAGDVLTRRALQSSIKALFGTGHFRDIRVHAEPTDEGVSLTFALSVHYRIGRIDLEGVAGANRRRAERRLGIRLGEVLSLNEVEDTALAIQEELRQFGHLDATVDSETTFMRERNRADVTFHITPGAEARVEAVRLQGDLGPFSQQTLVSQMREQPGRTFHLPDARGDVERIRNFLFGRDHRRASVEFLGHTYDAEAKTVALDYRVDVGPPVRVEVEGVPRRAVRRQLPFRSRDQEYSEDVVEMAAENIVRAYQQRGHFNATVDTESRLQDGVWVTTFFVDPGPRFRLAQVNFAGNARLSDSELERVVETTPRGGFRRALARLFRRPTGVTREQLAQDRDALESHYRLTGFTEAAVGTPAVSTRADGTMEVTFPITEGPQTIVESIAIEGVEQIQPSALPALQLRAGNPLNPQLIREDVVRLQTFYAERGHAEVQVTFREELSEDRTSARVAYLVTEGPRIEVADVIVRGNTYTHPEVILRTADLERGDPFTYTSILEAQRNLYRLGAFQRVDVQPEQAGTAIGERNVIVAIEEGRNLTVSGSLGARYDTNETEEQDRFSPRIATAAAHRNLFGTGRFLGAEVVWSQFEQEAFITYREPFVGRWNVPVQVNVFQTYDSTVRERAILQRGTSIEASKVARGTTRWSALYQYKISECLAGALCEQPEDIFVPGLDPSLLDIQISSITPTFFWDRRDDIIDPRRGFFTSASVEYAFPLFSAEAHFTKEFVQGAWYLPIGDRTVLALSGRIGFAQPLRGDDPTTPADEARFIPVAERFTAGGETSHRAYPRDLLGTLCDEEPPEKQVDCVPTLFRLCRNEDGSGRACRPGEEGRIVPLGGNSIFIVNAEYRFPIFATVGGALFLDVGNVFGGSSIDLRNLRYGIGGGVRYLSPVGPLRFDIGWPINRRPYDRAFSYSITLGYAF